MSTAPLRRKMFCHINTALIYQEFAKPNGCPLCAIRKIVEKDIVLSYLNEKVMVRDVRQVVNEKGFCAKHFDLMFGGQSKLGLALQTVTRLNVLKQFAEETDSARKAKKFAAEIFKAEKTCIICDEVENHMMRYCSTVARMFGDNPDCQALIEGTEGFCLHDYALLLAASSAAQDKKRQFVACVTKVENAALNKLGIDLQWFCDHHDYRNKDLPLGDAETALPRAREKIYGKK